MLLCRLLCLVPDAVILGWLPVIAFSVLLDFATKA